MKLKDLITLEEVKLSPKNTSKSISGVLKNNSVIGKGYQALVYDSKSKPDTVIKIVPILGEHDSAYQFLRLCVNNQNNPFLPNIHSYKSYNIKTLSADDKQFLDDVGYYALSDDSYKATSIMFIVTEKLEDSETKIINAFKKLGIPSEDDLMKYHDYNIGMNLKISYVVTNYFRSKANRLKLRNSVENKDFKNVMRLLEPLFKNYYPDLHLKNFMVRQNGELVFNDPIVQNTENLDLDNLSDFIPSNDSKRKTGFEHLTQDEKDLINKYKGKISSTKDYKQLPDEEQKIIKQVFKSEFRFLNWIYSF